MGENRETPNSIRRLSTIKQYRLTDAMIGALETGMPSSGTANVIGRSGTIVALIDRGLISTGRTHHWTQLGYDVAARILSGRVPTWAEGMAYADEVAAKQRAEVARVDGIVGDDMIGTVTVEQLAAPESAGAHAFRPGGRDWRGETSPNLCAYGDCGAAHESPVHTDRPHRVAYDGNGGVIEPGAGRYRSKSCCATTEGDVHARDCQTPAARKQWGPRALRTQDERAPEAAPQLTSERIEPGDLVTVDGADRRVWRVERVADFGDDENGREPWGELVHLAGTRTSIQVKRLSHATAAEILGAKRHEAEFVKGGPITQQLGRVDRLAPVATSQPATSQITMSGDAEQVLAGIAELIRGVRKADPELARTVARTQYDTLRAFLRLLTGKVEANVERPEAHPYAFDVLHANDVRRLVNATARELGIREPWAGGQ